ncbi:hypothetical protein TNCV_2412191 [Trichonephila clavipes]|nr:hypothetical protein TNCV_2412191 [Trichonephila clavipes]
MIRQMAFCQFAQDLEVYVSEFGILLSSENVRYLINSMPAPVTRCIATGDGTKVARSLSNCTQFIRLIVLSLESIEY